MTYPKVDFLPDDERPTPSLHPQRVGVVASPKFPAIEERILKYWDEDGTFMASVEGRDPGENGENEFVFYDGPPFANGLPHYGHLLTGYVKDLIPRYQTMRGRRVERRFGWDTHGLPAELEAQRVLGLKTKGEILELGIEEFNAACRESVLKYTDDWQAYVHRQGRWVDFEHDYKTLNPDYMESVIWAFKTLYDKGLVYEGYRVLPYCWNDETPLSNHELRMDDDVYQMRQDPAVTVGFRLDSGELALIWTTTPWTLLSEPGRSRSGPDIDYVVVARGRAPLAGERVILWPRRASRRTRRELGRGRRRAGSCSGSRIRAGRAAATPRRSATSSAATRTPAPRDPVRRLRHHRGRHRHRCTSRRPSARTTWSSPTPPASSRSFPSARRRGSPPTVVGLRQACRSSTPTCRSSTDLKARHGRHAGRTRVRGRRPRHRPAAPRDLRPLLPALLALPRTR